MNTSETGNRSDRASRGDRDRTRLAWGELLRQLRRLRPYVRAQRRGLLVLFVFVLLGALLPLAPPRLVGWIVDDVLINQRSPSSDRLSLLAWLCAAILVIQLLSAGVTHVRTLLIHRLGKETTLRLRAQLFRHLQFLPLRFHERSSPGSLGARVMEETARIESSLYLGLAGMLLAPFSFLGMAVVLFWIDAPLAAAVLIPIPVLAGLVLFFARRFRRLAAAVRAWSEELHRFLQEHLRAVRLIKLLRREKATAEGFEERHRTFLHHKLREETWRSGYFVLVSLVLLVGTLMVLAFGGVRVVQGSLTAGELVTFLAYLATFFSPLLEMSHANYLLQVGGVSLQRVGELLDQRAEAAPEGGWLPLPSTFDLQLQKLSFSYEPGKPVLQEVSFSVPEGTVLAVAGPTGAGKSTLLSLIAGLHVPEAGGVRLGGHDVLALDRDEFYGALTLVDQDEVLLDDTLRNNVLCGNPEASGEDWNRAAASACLQPVLECMAPEAKVGEGGLRLSRGERQRVAVARALIRRPRLLLLDEALSSVDPETESLILENLRRELPGATLIMVAHRGASLRCAERFVVLDRGRLCGEGTFEECLRSVPLFRQFVGEARA